MAAQIPPGGAGSTTFPQVPRDKLRNVLADSHLLLANYPQLLLRGKLAEAWARTCTRSHALVLVQQAGGGGGQSRGGRAGLSVCCISQEAVQALLCNLLRYHHQTVTLTCLQLTSRDAFCSPWRGPANAKP